MKITREHSVLTGRNTMKPVYCLPNMPVHFGCVDFSSDKDVHMNQEFMICEETGILQIKHFPTADLLYMTRHNDAIGDVWSDLFDSIVEVVKNQLVDKKRLKILEIGGGSAKLAEKILSELDVERYVIIEPNPLPEVMINNPMLEIVTDYFSKESVPQDHYDLILHSHVLEHVENPIQLIEDISTATSEDTLHVFVVPNLKEAFSRKYTNALNFEHTFFMTEEYIDAILNNESLEAVSKEYFIDHSIIYTSRKSPEVLYSQAMPNLFDEHYALLTDFIKYHEDFIADTNKKIKNFKGEIFLFGAHIFSQYLIGFGLNIDKIDSVLDNSKNKIGKRLYGTNLQVRDPIVVKDKDCAVILKVASYREEIMNQLIKINPNVVIIE